MGEHAIEGTVCRKAEAAGWIVRKIKWIGRVACMDRLFLKGGRIVLIEFKDKGEEPNTLQSREIERFRAAGAEVWVVDSIEHGLYVLDIGL